MRLGILGGTFDPVHNGHLFIADEAKSRLGLEKVVFVLSARPPHKEGRANASIGHRLEMLELAVAENNHFEISRLELEREGPSYTADTIDEILRNSDSRDEPFLIVGADEGLEIATWKSPETILDKCFLVVAKREGYGLENLREVLPEKTSGGNPSIEKVHVMETITLDISSSEIRARAKSGRPFRYLVPEPVWKYIIEKEVYG
ncbi:MAG: nicotinate-nucleotide adenylyltransferase [Actinomycetota bacterium]|nr:nicotinate-nucleotide adenylyltransferase [Actinomycetota bacterium]